MLLLLALGCAPGSHGPSEADGTDTAADTADLDTTGDDTPPEGCRATAAPADRDRAVVVSLPYTADADQSDVWAILTLSAAGELSDAGTRVTMGRATYGEVTFTPDGSLALVPTERGAVAVYDVANGVVVEEAYAGDFYAGRIVMDPSGEAAWIVDGNWADNGGGIYRVGIDCETGALSGEVRVLEARLAADLLLLEGGDALVIGRDVPGSAEADDFARVTWADPSQFIEGADAFGDNDTVVSDAAVAGGWLLVADHSEFSGVPTRIARVSLQDSAAPAATVEVEDPMAIVPFPDGSARALVASGYGDAYVVLDVEAGTTRAVSAANVQLPGSLVSLTRGPLDGLVLGSEVGGLRTLRLSADGVEDGGVFAFPGDIDAIPGAVGVAP